VPRSWRAVDNHRLRLCARRFANAYLIDRYAYSHDHPGWLRDGYPLTSNGQTAFALLVGIAAVVRGAPPRSLDFAPGWPARADEGARLESV
jgi:hypothetical protein